MDQGPSRRVNGASVVTDGLIEPSERGEGDETFPETSEVGRPREGRPSSSHAVPHSSGFAGSAETFPPELSASRSRSSSPGSVATPMSSCDPSLPSIATSLPPAPPLSQQPSRPRQSPLSFSDVGILPPLPPICYRRAPRRSPNSRSERPVPSAVLSSNFAADLPPLRHLQRRGSLPSMSNRRMRASSCSPPPIPRPEASTSRSGRHLDPDQHWLSEDEALEAMSGPAVERQRISGRRRELGQGMGDEDEDGSSSLKTLGIELGAATTHCSHTINHRPSNLVPYEPTSPPLPSPDDAPLSVTVPRLIALCTCPGCHRLLADPITFGCGHSRCLDCLPLFPVAPFSTMPLVNAVTVANLSSSSSITPTSPMPIDLDQSSSTSFSIPGSFPGRDTPSVPSEPSSSTRSSLQLTRPTCARPDCSYARYTPLPTLFSANPKTDYTLRKVVELLCQALLDVRADAVFHDGTSTPPLDHSFEPLFRDVPLPESEPPMPKRDDPSRTSSSSSSGGDGGEETLGNDDMKRAHKMKRDWTTSKKFKQSLRTNPEYGSDAIEDFTTPTAPRHPSTFPTRSISLDVSTVRTLLADLQSECECQVCFQLFYEPITCPCGHSFCQRCLARAYDHSQNCPLCRSDLPPQSYFLHQRPNATISALIATAFPDLDAERTASVREEELASLSNVPIFVCTTAWPGIKCFLHIFEPHYRLMIRRALDSSSREFGMVLPSGDGAGGVNAYGTMVRITSCTVMEDGRSIVQTVGTSRFRILERGMLDGYNIGRIERVDDVSPEQEQALEQAALARNEQDFDEWAEPDQPGGSSIGRGGAPTRPPMTGNVELSTQQLMQICVDFIWTLRAQSAPSVLERLNNTVGDMPQTPAEFTWWCGEVMPVEDHVKVALLQITSVRERLRLIVFWIEQFRSSWWYSRGCTIS